MIEDKIMLVPKDYDSGLIHRFWLLDLFIKPGKIQVGSYETSISNLIVVRIRINFRATSIIGFKILNTRNLLPDDIDNLKHSFISDCLRNDIAKF